MDSLNIDTIEYTHGIIKILAENMSVYVKS